MSNQPKEPKTLMGFHATLSQRKKIRTAADRDGASVASWLRMLALRQANGKPFSPKVGE